MYLSKYVSDSALSLSHLNHEDPSLLFQTQQHNCRAYLSHISRINLNIAFIEAYRPEDPKGKKRVDLYFGTFEGPPSKERSRNSAHEYLNQVYDIVSRKHRIAGRDLEGAILHAIDSNSCKSC